MIAVHTVIIHDFCQKSKSRIGFIHVNCAAQKAKMSLCVQKVYFDADVAIFVELGYNS